MHRKQYVYLGTAPRWSDAATLHTADCVIDYDDDATSWVTVSTPVKAVKATKARDCQTSENTNTMSLMIAARKQSDTVSWIHSCRLFTFICGKYVVELFNVKNT